MYTAAKNVYRERLNFAKINTSIPIPNLIEIQKNSYERFLQMRVLPAEREDAGLQSVFKSVFPITDLRENCSLEFVEYSIGNWECKCGRLVGLDKLGRPCTFCAATIITDPRGDREIHCPKCGHLNENRPVTCDTCDEPVGLKLKYDVDECQERGMTFAVPLKVTIRLVVWDKDPDTQARTIRDIKEQEVYFGDIPLMTDNGTFIINGTERVIVSQLHRSPGAFFHSEDKTLYIAQIIPYRGSWVEFEYDTKNLLYVRIDRKRKFLASVFLRALGLRGADEIIRAFYSVDKLHIKGGKIYWSVADSLVGLRAATEIHVPGGEVTKYLLKLRRNPANVDDIAHLGNRRVRSVGELLENQFRIGLVRMERAIKEKMSVYQEMATAMPHDLINANAGGNPKYKSADIVEADELVSEDGRARKKGVEFEPYSFYLSAWEEDQYVIAQANAKVDGDGRLTEERVSSRQAGNFILSPRANVQFIDV